MYDVHVTNNHNESSHYVSYSCTNKSFKRTKIYNLNGKM